MNFTDKTTIFAQVYEIADEFLSKTVDFCIDVMLAPFPFSQDIVFTLAEYPIITNLFPGLGEFWYNANTYEWSTAKVILFSSVTFVVLFAIGRFILKLITDIIDMFT